MIKWYALKGLYSKETRLNQIIGQNILQGIQKQMNVGRFCGFLETQKKNSAFGQGKGGLTLTDGQRLA